MSKQKEIRLAEVNSNKLKKMFLFYDEPNYRCK